MEGRADPLANRCAPRLSARRVVDPEIEVVKVYRRSDAGTFDRPIELRREDGQSIESPLLPGFSLPLDDLFAEPA